MIVIDTNVFTEYMAARPAREVEAWRATVRPDEVYLTAITRAEIRQGIANLPEGRRRTTLQDRAERALAALEPRTLSFDAAAADRYGDILAERNRAGRPISVLDAQIAAIAVANRATVATRDFRGFEGTGAQVVNPWSFTAG